MHWYSRVRHIKRHFAEVLPYLTLRKVYNLQLSLLEKHLRKAKLRSSPSSAKDRAHTILPTTLSSLPS